MSNKDINRPSSDGCCKLCAKDGKYLLDVSLNGNWWHFKCVETKAEARRWMAWRKKLGQPTRFTLGENK